MPFNIRHRAFSVKRKPFQRFSAFKPYSTYTWKSQAVTVSSSHLLITWEIFQIFYPFFHVGFFISLKKTIFWTNNKYRAFLQFFILTLNYTQKTEFQDFIPAKFSNSMRCLDWSLSPILASDWWHVIAWPEHSALIGPQT